VARGSQEDAFSFCKNNGTRSRNDSMDSLPNRRLKGVH